MVTQRRCFESHFIVTCTGMMYLKNLVENDVNNDDDDMRCLARYLDEMW